MEKGQEEHQDAERRRMRAEETLSLLDSEKARKRMEELYGREQAEENTGRYRDQIEKFKNTYGDKDIFMFSAPGRTEISGNHTDHNHGKVLAGSINLDCVGIAAKNDSSKVNLVSETFNQKFTIVYNYMLETWGINLDDLREIVLRRQQEIPELDMRSAVLTPILPAM